MWWINQTFLDTKNLINLNEYLWFGLDYEFIWVGLNSNKWKFYGLNRFMSSLKIELGWIELTEYTVNFKSYIFTYDTCVYIIRARG